MTKRKYTCCRCGRPTSNYLEYDHYLANLLGESGSSTCSECARKHADFILWENEQVGSYIVCPWCGYEDRSSLEVTRPTSSHECPDCGKIFSLDIEIDITYITKKRKCDYPGELPPDRVG